MLYKCIVRKKTLKIKEIFKSVKEYYETPDVRAQKQIEPGNFSYFPDILFA